MIPDPSYKETDVGVIPEDWDVATLGDIFDISAGGDYNPSVSSHYRDAVFPYPIYSNALTDAGLYGYTSSPVHRNGSVTVTARGMIGSANFRDTPFTAIGRVIVMYPKGMHDGRYFSTFINERIEFAVESTGVPQLTAPQISRYLTFVPPLSEQRAIATALSDADALIASLDALIAKKRDLKQAAMQQLLTGKKRLPGFTGDWEVKRLAKIASIRNEKINTLGAGVASFCVELEQIGQNTGQIYGYSDARSRRSVKYRFRKGDVLFGRLRPYLRKFWHADCEGVCSTEIWPLIPLDGQLVPGFLFQTVQTEGFIEAANSSYGTHMPRSDWKALTQFEVLVPSDPVEQFAIAEVLADMDAERAALEAKAAKARSLKQGMMQELLTGRIRLL